MSQPANDTPHLPAPTRSPAGTTSTLTAPAPADDPAVLTNTPLLPTPTQTDQPVDTPLLPTQTDQPVDTLLLPTPTGPRHDAPVGGGTTEPTNAPSAGDGPSTAVASDCGTIDGELPRLGSTSPNPTPSPAPSPPTTDQAPRTTPAAPSLTAPAVDPAEPTPTAAPTTTSTAASAELDLPVLPTLPTATPVLGSPTGIDEPDAEPTPSTLEDADVAEGDDDGPIHPMAHLMPQKTAPSEASRKAAELRAAKKAKAKKVKFAVAAGCLLVAVAVGPPLFKWLGNAINDAGSTSTEQPAD